MMAFKILFYNVEIITSGDKYHLMLNQLIMEFGDKRLFCPYAH